LVRPYTIAREIDSGSAAYDQRPVRGGSGLWWALFLANSIVWWIAGIRSNETIDSFIATINTQLIGDVIHLLSGIVVVVRLILRVTMTQEVRRRKPDPAPQFPS
jgi:hypothetical protein